MDGDNKKQAAPEEATSWNYTPSSGDAAQAGTAAVAPAAGGDVEWSASEFVTHEKTAGWYVALIMGAMGVAVLLYLITRDIFSSSVIIVLALILAVAASHKPRVITYRLTRTGIAAGKRFYPYSNYKAFAMPDDGPFTSVVLIPLKRFDLPVSAYLAPDSQQKVIEALSTHLPLERGELDSVDRLMRQLRF